MVFLCFTEIVGVSYPACLHSGLSAEQCRCLPGVSANPPILFQVARNEVKTLSFEQHCARREVKKISTQNDPFGRRA